MTRSSSDSLSRFRLGRVLGYTCCCLLFDQILSMWITFLRRPTSRSELYQLGWGAALHRDSRPDQSEAGMRFGPTAASERWWLYLSESETISSIKPETPVTCSTTEPVNLTGQGFTEISLSDQDGHSTSDFDTECQRISLIDFISASCWSICLSFSHSCIHSSERFFSFLFASPYCTCCYSGCLSSDIFVRVVSCRLLLICGEQKKRVTRLELLQMENVMYSLGCSNRSVDMTDETKWTTGRQAAGHIGLNRVESGWIGLNRVRLRWPSDLVFTRSLWLLAGGYRLLFASNRSWQTELVFGLRRFSLSLSLSLCFTRENNAMTFLVSSSPKADVWFCCQGRGHSLGQCPRPATQMICSSFSCSLSLSLSALSLILSAKQSATKAFRRPISPLPPLPIRVTYQLSPMKTRFTNGFRLFAHEYVWRHRRFLSHGTVICFASQRWKTNRVVQLQLINQRGESIEWPTLERGRNEISDVEVRAFLDNLFSVGGGWVGG